MKLPKKQAALLLSAFLALPSAALPAAAVDPIETEQPIVLKSDINADGAVNVQDLVIFSKYLLGSGELSEKEYLRADINEDGSTDTFDLVSLRKACILRSAQIPQGTWIGTGFSGTRYFWFDENMEGTLSRIDLGGVTPFTLSASGSTLTFKLSSGVPANASISWVDAEHFYLQWEGLSEELFTYGSSERFDKGPFLKGEYISDKGRSLNLTTQYSGTLDSESITVLPMKNSAKFIYSDGTSEVGTFSRTDTNHFSFKWEDGSVESFTRREIKVVDGITYVNGILVANKTYSLPSTYAPGALTSEFNAAFKEMTNAAVKDNISLWICSGYRSYSYQNTLYTNYVARDGKAAADTYSARPGHSEHQTGLAADINYADSRFVGTAEAKWLAQNCWKYGFIIRYPKGKDNITGYQYEPWHIRYLGKETAKLVYESGLTLEEYLGIDSVYKNP